VFISSYWTWREALVFEEVGSSWTRSTVLVVKMKLIEIVELVTIHMFSLNLLAYNVLTVNLIKDTSVIIKIMNVTNVTTTV
jgi:hypothetical protein